MWPRKKVDRALREVAHGRFERSLSGLTAAAAVVTGRGLPGALPGELRQQVDVESGAADAAAGGRPGSAGSSRSAGPRPRCRSRPALYTANGLLGEYFHARGVARKPGGLSCASYNLAMGPPILAPG